MSPDWFDEFLAQAKRRGVKESTLQNYRMMVQSLRGKNGLRLPEDADSEEIFLDKLAKIQAEYEPYYYQQLCIIIRSVLKRNKRDDLLENVPLVKLPDRKTRIEQKLLTADERKRLIEEAYSLSLRLLVSLLDECGGRIGEIAALKIKSVQFDKYSAFVTLTGKTGTRRRRVYQSVPDLRHYLNNHPCRNDPEAPLFATKWGKNGKWTPYTTGALRSQIKKHALKVLKRKITPHAFRHSRATDDAKYFTDREMMLLNGWNNSNSVSVYSHLSMRDVDDKDLVLHGMKAKEEILRPIAETIRCPECHEENAPIAVYCVKCGSTLAKIELAKENKQLREEMNQLKAEWTNWESVLKTKLKLKA